MASDPPASTREWQRIPPSRVELAIIQPTHGTNERWVMDKHRCWWRSYSGDIYPHLVREPAGLRCVDGHHRLERDRQLGRRWTWARIHEP